MHMYMAYRLTQTHADLELVVVDTGPTKSPFFTSPTFWDGRGALENGCKGPILFYTGNEGPIDAFWNISGFVNEVLAQKLGALVVFGTL